jgi:hypothetical protein
LSDVFAANGTTGDIFSIRLEPGDTLLGQLEATDDGPPRVTLEPVLDVIDSSLSTLPLSTTYGTSPGSSWRARTMRDAGCARDSTTSRRG